MDRDRFDDLTKRLATASPSRRRVLTSFGGALLGGLGLRGASAAKGGNSACAHFCAQLFGADTPEAGQCTSDAAHGNPSSLCAQCGANPDNYCGGACCASGQVCLDNDTCVTPCDVSNPSSCSSDVCVCIQDASQAGYCTSNGTGLRCITDRDCPQGQFCVLFGGGNLCTLAC